MSGQKWPRIVGPNKNPPEFHLSLLAIYTYEIYNQKNVRKLKVPLLQRKTVLTPDYLM